MSRLQYYPLIWINYHASAILILGIPIVLTYWALLRQESSIIRLLEIYWKTSGIFPCIMLFPPQWPYFIYAGSCITSFLIILSLWFWTDLNEELANLPSCGGLTFAIHSWRWATSFQCLLNGALSATAFNCSVDTSVDFNCEPWLVIPRTLYRFNFEAFAFIFGSYWKPAIPVLIGSLCVLIYISSLVHWLIFIFPCRGRIAGKF